MRGRKRKLPRNYEPDPWISSESDHDIPHQEHHNRRQGNPLPNHEQPEQPPFHVHGVVVMEVPDVPDDDVEDDDVENDPEVAIGPVENIELEERPVHDDMDVDVEQIENPLGGLFLLF